MITLYTKDNCQQCKMVKRYLDAHQLNFAEINVSKDETALKFLKDQGINSVPVLIHQDEMILGFALDKLKKLAS